MKKQLNNYLFGLKNLGIFLIVAILLFTGSISIPSVIAEEETFPSIHLLEWNSDCGLTHTVQVITGHTYTFTCLFRAKKATPGVRLTGTAIGDNWLIVNDIPSPGVKYDVVTGELTYSFKAKGTELIMGVYANSMNGGQYEAYFAKPRVYESDLDGNQSSDQFFDCNPKFDESWEKWYYGGDYRHIEQVTTNVFVKNDFITGLASLSVGYDLSQKFDYRVLYYDVTVPYEVTSLDISYTLMNGVKLRKINGNKDFIDGQTNEVSIIVQGKKQDDSKDNLRYILRVFRKAEDPAQVTKLDVGYNLVPKFSPDVFEYQATIPNEVNSITVDWEGTNNTHLVSITGNTEITVGKIQDTVITVANSSGHEVTYTVKITRLGGKGDPSQIKNILAEAVKKVTPSEVDLADDLVKKLEEAADHKISIVLEDYCKLNAISQVEDNYGTIIPGTKGYISALASITDGNIVAKEKIYIELQPDVVKYTFTDDEISKDEDFVLDDNNTYLVEYNGNAKKVVIPDTVKEIGFNWYQPEDKKSCEVLVLPDNVQYLPDNLCFGMYHLETVYIGDGISIISPYCFNHCYFLQNVRFSENLTKIESNAFGGCCSLYNVRFPETLKEISNAAFTFTLMRDVTLPKGVNSVKSGAFSGPFNAWLQLVKGSDNEYFMFVFNSVSDPDCIRLGEISDAHVDYWDYYGTRYANYYDTLLGQYSLNTQSGINPWAKGYLIPTPRTITVLNKDAALSGDLGYTVNGFYSGGNTLRLPNNINKKSVDDINQTISELNTRYEKSVSGSKNAYKTTSPVGYKYETLNMRINEVAARAQRALDVAVFSKKTTAKDVMDTIQNAIVTEDKSIQFSWDEPFSVNDGIISGVIEVKNANYSYKLTLKSALKDIAEAGKEKVEKNEEINVALDTANAPISLLNNSCAIMDWKTGFITAKPYITIKDFLNTIKIKDGFRLKFFDDEGYEIYDKFYNTAYLEENFILQVNKGLSRVNDLVFRCSYPLDNDHTLSNQTEDKIEEQTVNTPESQTKSGKKKVAKVIRVPKEVQNDNTWMIYLIIACAVIISGGGIGTIFILKNKKKRNLK